MPLPPQPLSPLFITSSPPPLEQPDTVEEENYNDEEENEDDDEKDKEDKKGKEEDKMSLPPVPVSFMSCWKAVSRREALPGTVSLKYNTDNLFYYLIKC